MPDSELLERLEARAAPVNVQPRRGLNYNYPLAWYRRPDGDIVQLQADPNNRTFYEDLGFVMLRPPEVDEWLNQVRPPLIAEQRRRARLITAIRRLEHIIPQLVLDDDLQLEFPNMPIDDLEQHFKDFCEQFGQKPRLPTLRTYRDDAPQEANLRGVDTSMSMEELDAKLKRGQGYDPIDQSRRRPRA